MALVLPVSIVAQPEKRSAVIDSGNSFYHTSYPNKDKRLHLFIILIGIFDRPDTESIPLSANLP
jgi:hypothetical protein